MRLSSQRAINLADATAALLQRTKALRTTIKHPAAAGKLDAAEVSLRRAYIDVLDAAGYLQGWSEPSTRSAESAPAAPATD